MLATSIIVLVASLLGASQAQSVGSCPTAEYKVTAQDGSIYAVCRDTDFRGETAQQVFALDAAECADACQQEGSGWCSMAVFEPQQSTCHLKSGPLDWVRDTRYTTVRRIQEGNLWERQSEISSCPTGEATVNSAGITLAICRNTDYQGETVEAVPEIFSVEACADACAVDNQCYNAVYDRVSAQCYIKTSRDQLRWIVSSEFDSIRVVGN